MFSFSSAISCLKLYLAVTIFILHYENNSVLQLGPALERYTWQQYCKIRAEIFSVKSSFSLISGVKPLFVLIMQKYCYRLLSPHFPTLPLLTTSRDGPSGQKFGSAYKRTMSKVLLGKGVLTTNNQTRKLQNA